MKNVKVKICGITREEDLDVAVNAGADAVGFVVNTPSSPRNISVEIAGELMEKVPPFVKSVLVIVPKNILELTKTYEKLIPDVVQIHGKNKPENAHFRAKFPRTQLIRGINANPDNAIARALEASREFDNLIVDSFVEGKYGGTGIVHDWEVSKRIRQIIHPKRLILAGGLNPKNVRDAILKVQPYAVDVSSGVEAEPGIKDKRKIVEFIENAKGV